MWLELERVSYVDLRNYSLDWGIWASLRLGRQDLSCGVWGSDAGAANAPKYQPEEGVLRRLLVDCLRYRVLTNARVECHGYRTKKLSMSV